MISFSSSQPRLVSLDSVLFTSVWLLLPRKLNRTLNSARSDLCVSSHPDCTEVLWNHSTSYRLHDDQIASFVQTFYYFRRYSRKDGWGTKAVVRPDGLPPVCQVLMLDR